MKKIFAADPEGTKTGGDISQSKPPKEVKDGEKTPLKPTLTTPSAKHGKTEDVIVLRRGQVYVVPLNNEGQEIPGAGFVTNTVAANKHYANPKKFVIKKKAS